jgi:hypothetical protein
MLFLLTTFSHWFYQLLNQKFWLLKENGFLFLIAGGMNPKLTCRNKQFSFLSLSLLY